MKMPLILVAGLAILLEGCEPKVFVNQEKPVHPGAGRVLERQELLEFENRLDKSSFRLNTPDPLQADSRGSLYVLDQDRLVKFFPDGRFAWELSRVERPASPFSLPVNFVSYVVWRDEPYICNGIDKIVHLDMNGKLVGEVALPEAGFHRIVAMCEGGYVVFTQTLPDPAGPNGITDQTFKVECLSPDGKASKKIWESPVRVFKEIYQGKSSVLSENRFISAFDPAGRTLYLSYTNEYQVVKVDLAGMKVGATFTRKYQKVKSPPGRIPEFRRDYYPAIGRMCVSDRNLWVGTYTRDEVKGRMFDVFDPRGRFIDNFFMPLIQSGICLPADGGLLYNLTPSVGGEVVAKKYKILNGPKVSGKL